MHDWFIGDEELERQQRRRGRRHAYGPTRAGTVALVVVDMIPHFLTEGSVASAIAPAVDDAAGRLRDVGGAVVWVVPTTGPASNWQIGFFGATIAESYAASGGPGRPVERIDRRMRVEERDLVVEKSSASAFFPGSSDLHALLRSRGVERVLIAGTVTSVCCESTARDAATLGYEVIVLGDCTADVSDDAHNASLRTLYRSFADVRSAHEALQLVR